MTSELLLTDMAHSAAARLLVPRKVHRGCTDMLKLLSNTIDTSTGSPGAHDTYTFIDDPFLLPRSNNEKRSFALARVSGERAAKFVVNKFPFAFHLHQAIPEVPLFDPGPKRIEDRHLIDPTPNKLIELMDHNRIEDAVRLYEALQRVCPQLVTPELKLCLLECACAYKHEYQYDQTQFIETWYGDRLPDENPGHWVLESFCQSLYDEVASELTGPDALRKTQRARCAMINAYCLHGQPSKAIRLSSQSEDDIPCAFTLRNLIRASAAVYDQCLAYLRGLLERNAAVPHEDSRIFSAVFYALKEMCRRNRKLKPEIAELTTGFIAEMNRLGVKQSFGTLSSLVQILLLTRNVADLDLIVDWAENVAAVNFEGVRELDDSLFFDNAMFAAWQMGRFDLGRRLFNLISTSTSIQWLMFPNERIHRRFFTRFISLACSHCPDVETVEDLWLSIVPVTCLPGNEVISEFVDFVFNFNLVNNKNQWPVRLLNDIILSNAYFRDMGVIAKLVHNLRHYDRAENEADVCEVICGLFNKSDRLLSPESQGQNEALLNDVLFLLIRQQKLCLIGDLLGALTHMSYIEPESLRAAVDLFLQADASEQRFSLLLPIMRAFAKHCDHGEFDSALKGLLQTIVLSKADVNTLQRLHQPNTD